MIFKKNFLMIFFFRMIFFSILTSQVHSENSIEQEVKARGESTQQFVSSSLVSGSAEMSEYAENFFETYKRSTKFHPDKNIKRLLIFKKFNKVFFVLDKGSTAYEVYTANKKRDYVGIGEAVINDVGSGLTSLGGITILSAAGFAASPIVLFGGSLVGAFVYNYEGKRLVGLLADELDDYIGYVENDPRFKTKAYKEKVKRYYLEMCRQTKKEYIKTKIRPSKVYFDLCIKYGIDIYDLCPDDPKKLPGVCGCDTPDIDSDRDGVFSCDGKKDECDDNPKLTKKGKYGCQTEEEWREDQLDKKKCPKNAIAQWSYEKNRPLCYCLKGFIPDKSGYKCVNKEEINRKPFKSCKGRGGVTIYQGNRSYCVCEKPLEWNQDETKCICPDEAKWDTKKKKCLKQSICGKKLSHEQRTALVRQLKHIQETRWSKKNVSTYNEYGALKVFMIGGNYFSNQYEANIPAWNSLLNCWDGCIMGTSKQVNIDHDEYKRYGECLKRCKKTYYKNLKKCP